MRYFERLRVGVEVTPFLKEVEGHPVGWSASTGRQEKIAVQREAHAIPLRGLRKSAIGDRKRRDVHDSRWTNLSKDFPFTIAFLHGVSAELNASLGRAKLVRLPAGKRVYPHIDRGEYYKLRDRYHLVLLSRDGSWLKAGDEEVTMREGELWRFDNKQLHEACNHGSLDRIHLIFDLLPIARAGASDAAA